jgi:hypothetical protein
MKHSTNIALATLFLCFGYSAPAQVYSNKEVGKKNEMLIDSLKKAEYPYALPIWGKKVTAMGYDLPYSAGVSVQYFNQVSDIVIENLMVGFNNGTMYNVDELIRFDKAKATAGGFSVRPDVWVFPFLNVYAILGQTNASTEVGFGLWLPDSTNTSQKVFSAASTVDFKATTFGFGMTPTIGVAGGFLALDMNVAWTDVPQLSKPAMSFVFGPRMGKSFKLKKPGRNISVWVGGFRVHLNSETEGSIALSDVMPPSEIDGKIDAAYEKVASAQQKVDSWWAGLTQQQQSNPINQAKYAKANSALDRASEFLVNAEDAANNIGSSTVQYSMDKRPKDMWNIVIGSQFQLNKHLMARLEYGGFVGSRTQVMAGIQYRFGL